MYDSYCYFCSFATQNTACRLSWDTCLYVVPHRLQENGRIFSCTSLMWRAKPSLKAKFESQVEHLNGRSFKCTERLCLRKFPFSPNLFVHRSHANGRCPSWTVRICFRKSELCAKQWPHTWHVFRTIRNSALVSLIWVGFDVDELSRNATSCLLMLLLALAVAAIMWKIVCRTEKSGWELWVRKEKESKTTLL